MKLCFCLLFALFALLSNHSFARDWFQPLPTRDACPFVLETFQPVPYRFIYGGFISEKTDVRYLLKSHNGRLFALRLGETTGGLTLVNVAPSRQTLTVHDHNLNQTLTLNLGKETPLQNRFTGTLIYQKQHYPFSEQPLHLDEQTQLSPMIHEGNLYLVDQTQGKEPYIWLLQKAQERKDAEVSVEK